MPITDSSSKSSMKSSSKLSSKSLEAPLLTIPEWCPSALNKSFLQLSPQDRQQVQIICMAMMKIRMTMMMMKMMMKMTLMIDNDDEDDPQRIVSGWNYSHGDDDQWWSMIISRCWVSPIARLKPAILIPMLVSIDSLITLDSNAGKYWQTVLD